MLPHVGNLEFWEEIKCIFAQLRVAREQEGISRSLNFEEPQISSRNQNL